MFIIHTCKAEKLVRSWRRGLAPGSGRDAHRRLNSLLPDRGKLVSYNLIDVDRFLVMTDPQQEE